jgi:hypothetical protein
VLRRAAPYAVMAAVEESRSELAGIDVQVAPIRRYPSGTLAAQLLGYAGEINDRELEERSDKGYGLGDLIGKTGVERRYEDVLRGEDGAEFVVVNAMGKRVTTLEEGPPKLPISGATSRSRSTSTSSARSRSRWARSSAAPPWCWTRATAACSPWCPSPSTTPTSSRAASRSTAGRS